MKLCLSLLILVLNGIWVCQASHFRGAFLSWIVNETDSSYYPNNPSASNVKVMKKDIRPAPEICGVVQLHLLFDVKGYMVGYELGVIELRLSPHKWCLEDYNFKVHFNYGTSWRRSDGAPCTLSTIASCQQYNHGSWSVSYGSSKSSISNSYTSFSMHYYCERFTTTYDFNVGSKVVTLILPRTYVYRIQTTSCCWVSDLTTYADSSWNVQAVLEFGTNPATGKINRPPHVENLPVIEHNYYTTQTYILPVYDFDGDEVRCRWASSSTEGGGIWNSRKGTLDGNKCSLTFSSGMSIGWFPLAIIVEDYARTPSGTLQLQSQIPLQFTVLIHTARAGLQGQNRTSCEAPYPYPQGPTQSPTTTPLTTPGAYVIDGCSKYQVLKNQDRLSTYHDWSSFRCDKELYGWYRFMGGAGERLLDYCPNQRQNYYHCGSYYQGWLPSMPQLSKSQGAVSSSACFSMPGSCSCTYRRQIFVRNCGSFYVYWLNSVPQCNARYCGAKGNGQSVSCKQSNMKVELDRAQYNTSLYSSITLRDSSCYATLTGSKILAGSSPGTCGATRRETSTHIIYENELILKAKAVKGVVRHNDQRIKFSCKYSRNGTVSLLGYKPIYTINDDIDGYGNLSVAFHMYTDITYNRVHSYYPVNAQLRDWLYLEISANAADNSIVVLIDECFATPTMDISYPQKSVFIKNGCQSGEEFVNFHSAANNRNRFSVQAIRFLQNSTAVFIHCRFYLCYTSSTDLKCNRGCGYNRKDKNLSRKKRSVEEQSPSPSDYYLLNMEVRLKEDAKSPGSKVEKSINPVYIAGFGVGIALLVAVVALLLLKMNRMKRSNQGKEREECRERGGATGVDNKGLQLSPLS